MEKYISVMLCTAALFLAMILHLAAKPRFTSQLTGAFTVIAAVSGLFIYGYGYASTMDSMILAVIHALLGVCGMFVSKMDFSVVSDLPLFQPVAAQVFFWVVHLFAMYATASAAITTVGAEALRKLRLWLARRGELNLIYGVNEQNLELGKMLLRGKKVSVVFVDGAPDASCAAVIAKIGCVLRSDTGAVNADMRFLKSVGVRPGKRKITLYALGADEAQNVRYAEKLLKSLKERGVTPSQTTLVIPGREDSSVSRLQVLGDEYGYGYVTIFQEAGLAARLLVQTWPPCGRIAFDENCRATEDFDALIIGFGQLGQAVLRSLVMNGQFAGSRFHAAVFAPDCQSVNGYFSSSFEKVLDNYDITFHPYDGRSRQLFDYIRGKGQGLKYVAICTGSDKINREIAGDLAAFLSRQGIDVPLYLCGYRGVQEFGVNGKLMKLYQPQVLTMDTVDRLAMILNHHYCAGENTALENWMRCDYFSRMSSRASADFMSAVLRAAGRTAEQAMAGDWSFTERQMENLGEMEHKRWCAFHYCMGFSAMSEAEYDRRAAIWRQQMAGTGAAKIRIGKNMEQHTHACLIDWEQLDALSEKESAITGKQVNYKQLDMENIRAVPELLKASAKR